MLASASAPAGESSGGAPGGTVESGLSREVVAIPFAQAGVAMRTTVFRPAGAGPLPLLVMNHGSVQDSRRRAVMPVPEFGALSRWFARRGYVVALPQRPGHGETGGPYLEDQRGCDNADYVASGQATADAIETAVAFMRRQSYVRGDDIVVAGQSAGGWGALALASRNPAHVRAIINFAGGRGGRSYDRPNINCAPERLIAAAREFGRRARVPTLWIYTKNDSYFAPELSRRMAEAFRAAGDRVDYRLLAPFGSDGHLLAESPAGVDRWAPLVSTFLGMRRTAIP
jgi:dienelactone hydrolase